MMLYADLTIARHIAFDPTQARYYDNENPNGSRTGLSWEAAYRDGEGTIGTGSFTFIKATDTPYRMDLNKSGMSNDSIWCDCTGVGFERSSKKADFRASNTFGFTQHDGTIYSANIPDVLTGERAVGMLDYPGHYIFAETLYYEGAWGVWNVTGDAGNDVIPLTRVLNYIDLEHGKWCWAGGVMYICWVGTFNPAEFEVVQKAKAFEMWTDSLPTDEKRSSMSGIRSRFGLFGHHNGTCVGWRVQDCELAWNAIDGMVIIAENTYAKSYGLYTQVTRCHIHHNFRDGISNNTTPAGAAGRGASAYPDVNADFNYIHDNGGAGVFLHRLTRLPVDVDLQSVNFPFRLTNNTIINNARGIVVTDERMPQMIDTFGYDFWPPSEWGAKTYQQRVDYWNTLLTGYDTAWVKLRNNNVYDNDENTVLINDTWPGTTFVIDSDYNNIYPENTAWAEGSHSISVNPQFTEEPKISGNSELVGAGVTPFDYPMNAESSLYYYTEDATPFQWDALGDTVNIGAAASGPAYADLTISRAMPSLDIETKTYQVPVNDDSLIIARRSVLITTSVPYVEPEIVFESDAKDLFVLISGVWHLVLMAYIVSGGAWIETYQIFVLKDSEWKQVVY